MFVLKLSGIKINYSFQLNKDENAHKYAEGDLHYYTKGLQENYDLVNHVTITF